MALTMYLWETVFFIFLCKAVELLPKENFEKRSAKDAPPCENGWHNYDNFCYNFIANLSKWENASVECSSMGAHLASIHSQQQNDFITHFMMNRSIRNWWIGLHDPEGSKFVWEDGSDIDFSKCGSSELPNLCLMSGGCIEMFVYAHGRIKGLWKDSDCNNTKSFICQKRSNHYRNEDLAKLSENSSSLCEEGWHRYDQKCYTLEKNALSWEAASARCYNKGGYLVSIHSERENEFLADLILKNLVRHSWIGLHDRSIEGYYAWDDESDIDYTKWKPGEPSGYSIKSDDCVLIDYTKYKGISAGWVDSPCTLRKPYICQKQITTLSKETSAVTSIEMKYPCEEDWLHHGSFCYNLIRSPMKWNDALIFCASMNANLTSIHSQDEQDFLVFHIMRKVTTNLWIGLHDSLVENNFSWVDGLSIDYTNWGRGEPSGYFNHLEDCVEIRHRPRSGHTGQWNDAPCDTRNFFICQKRLQAKEGKSEWKCEHHGFISVTTFFVVISIVVISMVLLGAIFYYKRLWLEDKGVKLKAVIFRSSESDTERLTEIDIKDNQTADIEHTQKYNFFK